MRGRPTHSRLRARLAVAVAFLTAGLLAPAAAQADVAVYFLKGEQVYAAQRPGTTAQDAVNGLLAGPTAAEVRDGVRTYVPKTTTLRSVSVTGGVAQVDLGLGFIEDDTPDDLRARLTQLVHTLTGPEGAKGVKVLVDGGTPLGVFPGVATTAVLTVGYLETPNIPAPTVTAPPETSTTTSSAAVSSTRQAQQRLADLGYLLAADVDGKNGPVTQAGVIAFQKWERMGRTGTLNAATLKRLRSASRPTPRRKAPGVRTEVLLDRQVTLAIRDNRVVRTLHVSTGKASTPTPPGEFKVYGRFAKWWSTPFSEWLLWASAFNGGIAFHQLADVPVVAASHGCVRLTAAQAKWLYGFIKVGTQVSVISKS